MSARGLITALVCAAACGASSCSPLSRLFGSHRAEAPQVVAPTQTREAKIAAEPGKREAQAAPAPVEAEAPDAPDAAAPREERDPSVPVHLPQWDTVNLFAYRGVTLASLPETVMVTLDERDGFAPPAVGRVFSPYGRRGRRNHNGTDVAVKLGQPIQCAFDGVVRLSRWNSGGFGHMVIVRHPSGLETYYAHLSKRTVRAGDAVKAGQVIGLGGRTGRATALHLHFEVRWCDQSFDAERLIDFSTGELLTRTLALHKAYFSINSHARDEGGSAASTEAADSLAAETPPASADLSVAMAEAARAATTGAVTAPVAVPASPPPVYHKVRGGDTLYALARRYGTTVAGLCSLNAITSRTTLRIGRSLRVK